MMTFREYVENVNKLLEDCPHLAGAPVIYSKDDEGNGYHLVNLKPGVMYMESIKPYYMEQCEDTEEGFRVVCVN